MSRCWIVSYKKDDCPQCEARGVCIDKALNMCLVCSRDHYEPVDCNECGATVAYALHGCDDKVLCVGCFDQRPTKHEAKNKKRKTKSKK